MNKILINILINLVLLNIFIFIFVYSSEIKTSILFAFDIWVNNLIPSMFPFLLISNLLINYGFLDILSFIIGPFIEKVYKLPKVCAYPIVASIFTGFPTGSKYTKDLLSSNKISVEDANRLIMFTSFSNPLFIVSAVGETLLNNKKIGFFIFFTHLISGLLIGLLYRPRNRIKTKEEMIENTPKSFINVLTSSISDIFKILINMLGIIIFFLIIITILNTFLDNNLITIILKGVIEVTTGITYISSYDIDLRLKASLIGLMLSFNGLSVHLQTKSIIMGTKISYKRFFFARILHSLLCFSLIYIFYYLFC